VRLRFCGVRGSVPAPGSEFVRFGGNTSCVAVTPTHADAPSLLLDAGTGIRSVTELLAGAAFHGTILLTHLHWDHWQGLPFFGAGDRDDAEVTLIMPSGLGDPLEVLRRSMAPPHFPIDPKGLRGRWSFEVIDSGPHVIEGLHITAGDVPHKGGRTFGYRVEEHGRSFAYLPDHRPAAAMSDRAAALGLARGVDLLIHDAQFVAGEDSIAVEYGHATVDQAVAFAVDAGAAELVLFHHSPSRSDAALDRILDATSGAPLRVSIAVEGLDRVV